MKHIHPALRFLAITFGLLLSLLSVVTMIAVYTSLLPRNYPTPEATPVVRKTYFEDGSWVAYDGSSGCVPNFPCNFPNPTATPPAANYLASATPPIEIPPVTLGLTATFRSDQADPTFICDPAYILGLSDEDVAQLLYEYGYTE
jgi:hypothetical protein